MTARLMFAFMLAIVLAVAHVEAEHSYSDATDHAKAKQHSKSGWLPHSHTPHLHATLKHSHTPHLHSTVKHSHSPHSHSPHSHSPHRHSPHSHASSQHTDPHCQKANNGGSTCTPQAAPEGRKYCHKDDGNNIDFTSAKGVGGCIGDCSCQCSTCIDLENIQHGGGTNPVRFDFSRVGCGCVPCCFGDYDCGDPSTGYASYCEGNQVDDAEATHNRQQEMAFPALCTCAFAAAYGSWETNDDLKGELLRDWNIMDVGSEHYPADCGGNYICAKHKFLIKCQTGMKRHITSILDRCHSTGLLQNQTKAKHVSAPVDDDLVALLGEASKAKAGWNCA